MQFAVRGPCLEMTARLLNLSPLKLLRALLSRYLLFQAPQSHLKKCLAMISRDSLLKAVGGGGGG